MPTLHMQCWVHAICWVCAGFMLCDDVQCAAAAGACTITEAGNGDCNIRSRERSLHLSMRALILFKRPSASWSSVARACLTMSCLSSRLSGLSRCTTCVSPASAPLPSLPAYRTQYIPIQNVAAEASGRWSCGAHAEVTLSNSRISESVIYLGFVYCLSGCSTSVVKCTGPSTGETTEGFETLPA